LHGHACIFSNFSEILALVTIGRAIQHLLKPYTAGLSVSTASRFAHSTEFHHVACARSDGVALSILKFWENNGRKNTLRCAPSQPKG
jgi:hypothetical protein